MVTGGEANERKVSQNNKQKKETQERKKNSHKTTQAMKLRANKHQVPTLIGLQVDS